MEEEHQDLHKPIYGALRNLKITQSRKETEESTNQQRDFTCYYGLRENPKKKTQESPEPMKKILFRCEECGKGFRYEKCFSNHRAMMHLSTNQKVYEESVMSLCRSLSFVRKKKRSRHVRYKKTSFSCSFTTFHEPRSVFAANDEELEVADCLILLSESTPKFVDGLKLLAEAVHVTHETPKSSYDLGCLRNKKPRKGGEFEYGVFSNEHRFMEEGFSSYGTSKEPASFLRDNRLDQQKRRKAGEFGSGFLSNEQRMLKEEITTPVTFKGPASFLGYKCVLDQQKLRNGGEFGSEFLSNEQKLMEGTWKEPASFLGTKIELEQRKLRKAGDFETGYYRTELGVGAMECSDSDTEMITESDKKNVEHQCRLCNKILSSYQALGGHQTIHRMSKCKNKKNFTEELVEPEDESMRCSVTKRRRNTSVASFQGISARFML
ncbi:Zinc finger C2H2-type [Arabidopsis thaliana x Arabidopsis arenosa]|uniref:Zinc finger C2H2-type n=1 Tax=Arabidopsis thaliana x Arabidopsis arenosa TaxID=1240361 RepID=A0A8T1YW59_9BRAS|nr:Zinc finger C2H2-type [Arabidopsis thaliana x Arabidopsis arenosa]